MGNVQNLRPLKRPDGLVEIIGTFGDINSYIKTAKSEQKSIDPEFERKYITTANLPYHLRLAWDHKKEISAIKCHHLLVGRFQAVFEEIAEQNLCDMARYFGGCYAFRAKRNGRGFSTHARGIAIDINPETNKQGRPGDMAPEIVAIFSKYGFIWGGKWHGKKCDPMHFQYCSGH